MSARHWIAIGVGAVGVLLLIRATTVSRIADAIGFVESGGRYDAVGPTTKSGNRAYGKYQVMDFNIPTWTADVLGRSLTPGEWLADHAAQDTVARAKIAEYFGSYPNAADVASLWFSGRPLAQASGSSDVTGTSVPEYVRRVLDALS